MGEAATEVGTGKSKFTTCERSVINQFPILGSTSVIDYDDSFDYGGNFILAARVDTNAGTPNWAVHQP